MVRFVDALERRRLLCAAPAVPGAADAGAHHPASYVPAGRFDLGPSPGLAFVTPSEAAQPGTWAAGPAMPASLAEVATGVIDGKLYVVGELDPTTFVYDLAANTWSAAAARPHPGNHHAAEVINGKLYLFGGFDFGSEGAVQVYDPAANAWTKGADMPFAAGSSATSLIGGKVYVAGGIVGGSGAGGTTTNRAAAYDPATDAWTELAPMPQARNHTAAATDGQRMYVFGGRGPGSGDRNVTTNGFDTFQLYDPATNIWQSSDAPGSTLPPLPQARGGMGKAVYLGGRFYVIGGETLTGPGATGDGVYRRVDVYDPTANAWDRDADMPTARHGIFPVDAGGKIYVAGGGVHFGGSASGVLEVFTPAAPEPPPPPPPPPPPTPATVVGRWTFYNNSAFDGNDPAATAADDAAVAPDKQALLPGQAATFAHYTSYSRGINGVMVDLADLPSTATPTAADFVFRTGNDSNAAAWPVVPAPPASVTVRRGAGVNGSDRVTMVWTDGLIQKTWLRVTILPTANTALAAEDVFSFGNWPGETGNRAGDTRVNKADTKLTQRNRTRRATPPPAIDSRFDFDRNGVVDVQDRRVVAGARTKKRLFLSLIDGS
jgi:N-acetylneuraminic acid mutarotase